jgi:undecaprenyl-diphosphatase
MVAASGLDLVKSNFGFNSSEWILLGIGFIAAFITALLAVQFFLRYIEKHSFVTFGWYRIIIGIAILLWII